MSSLPPLPSLVCPLALPLPACLSLLSLPLSPLFPPQLPASLYLIDVGLGAAVLPGGTILVSSLILLPLEQKENWLPVVQHLPLQPEERRGGEPGDLHPRLPAPAVSSFSHFARNAFELLPDPIVCRANGVQRPAMIRCTVCKRRKERS